MTMTDPIAAMLARTRNALMAKHTTVSIPSSKMKISIAKILKDEGLDSKGERSLSAGQDRGVNHLASCRCRGRAQPVRRRGRGG